MKHLYKILSFATAALASFSITALPLATAVLTACGNDNTAGTDEQPNAITAQIDAAIDSASAIWFQEEKTFIVDSKTNILPPFSTPLYEHGLLRQLEIDNFASFSCETEETWFAYTIQVTSSLIQKTFTIPKASAASIVTEFEADCTRENGEFTTEAEGVTEGQQRYSCKIFPTKENLVDKNAIQYTDPTWEKYGKLIIKICRE